MKSNDPPAAHLHLPPRSSVRPPPNAHPPDGRKRTREPQGAPAAVRFGELDLEASPPSGPRAVQAKAGSTGLLPLQPQRDPPSSDSLPARLPSPAELRRPRAPGRAKPRRETPSREPPVPGERAHRSRPQPLLDAQPAQGPVPDRQPGRPSPDEPSSFPEDLESCPDRCRRSPEGEADPASELARPELRPEGKGKDRAGPDRRLRRASDPAKRDVERTGAETNDGVGAVIPPPHAQRQAKTTGPADPAHPPVPRREGRARPARRPQAREGRPPPGGGRLPPPRLGAQEEAAARCGDREHAPDSRGGRAARRPDPVRGRTDLAPHPPLRGETARGLRPDSSPPPVGPGRRRPQRRQDRDPARHDSSSRPYPAVGQPVEFHVPGCDEEAGIKVARERGGKQRQRRLTAFPDSKERRHQPKNGAIP